MATARRYAHQLDADWHSYALRHHQTGFNLLIGQIMRLAITTDPATGEPQVDTSKIDLRAPWR